MKSVFAVAAVAALSVSSASAADLAPHLITKAPPIAAIYDWTGFYVGGHGGIGWAHGETSAAEILGFGALPSHPTNDHDSVFGGGQIGFNYQFARNWVIGIQGDWSAFSASDDGAYSSTSIIGIPVASFTGQYSTRIDWLASVTGRLGYAVNNMLFYGKGGAAWIRNRFHDASTADLGGIFVASDYSGTATRQGWTIGGGVEYGLTRNWTIGFEYDYYDFGSYSQTLTGATAIFIGGPGVPTGTQTETLQFKQTLSVAKASLNYRF